jgi:hypothetical protein
MRMSAIMSRHLIAPIYIMQPCKILKAQDLA